MNNNSVGIVVVAYKINQSVIDRFFDYNRHDNIFCVTDGNTPDNITKIDCPEMEIFSITKTANIGIRQAIKKHDVVIKTDIDCILTDDVINHAITLPVNMGACWRYWHVTDPDRLDNATLDKRCIGTALLHSQSWEDLNGYNENMTGYGFDDGDLRARARAKGITMPTLIKPELYHIWHDVKHNRDTINPLMRVKNIAARKNYKNERWGTLLLSCNINSNIKIDKITKSYKKK